MPLLFIDYTNLVLKNYEGRRGANKLSRLLMDPTTVNLRNECLCVYNERIKEGKIEEDILRAFFGVPPVGRNFDYLITRHPADKFRPLRSLMKGKIMNPALVTVELLAWLLDFNPRPLAYAQKILGASTDNAEPANSIRDNNEIQNETNAGDTKRPDMPDEILSDPNLVKENLSRDGKQQRSSKPGKLKIAALVVMAIVIFFAGMYIFNWREGANKKSFGNANTGCMYWANDHYAKVPCDEEAKGRLILPFNEERWGNFKRITREDTISAQSVEKIYYIKRDGKIEYFTSGGNHPVEVNRSLKILSQYMFDKYLRKKDSLNKDTLPESNSKLTSNQ